jgi:4-amino-4-deoxy-L-arabinose transferase-like glycosyltransferase
MRKSLFWTPRNNQILFIVLIVSVLLRLVAALYLGDSVEILPGTYDQVSYHNLALRVLDGRGFTFGELWWPITAANAPTAHWSYLYTFYLVIVYALFGPHPLAARLIQALIVGLLQPLLAYLIARRVFGQLVGLVAAVFTAVYVYFIYYTATLMTEPFYITAILAGLYFSICTVDHFTEPLPSYSLHTSFALALGLGLALGIAVLLRQLFLLIIPFLFLWIWWTSLRRTARSPIPALLFSSIMIAVLILPFTIYNYARFRRFVLLNTNAGYAFFWANHPIYGTHFQPILPPEMSTYQSLIPAELHHLDEAALDQALLKRGLQFVLDDPVRYLRLSLSRIPAYFMFWPSPDSGLISNVSRVSSFGLFLPFMLYGLLLSLFNRDHQNRRQPVPSTTKARPERSRRDLPTEASPTFQHSNLPPSTPTPNPSSPSSLVPSPLIPNPLSPTALIPVFTLSSPAFLLILFSGVYTTIHLLSWALIRYRLPVDAVLLIFAALALVDIAQRLGVTRWTLRHAN